MNSQVRFVTFFPLLALLLMFAVTAGAGEWTIGRIVGVVLTIVGDALLTAARFNLGNSFSVTAQAKKLVTNGIYSRVQHPVYVFSTLTLVGLALYFGQPWWLLALIVLIPVQFVRARKESQILEETFGDEYCAWKRTTWF